MRVYPNSNVAELTEKVSLLLRHLDGPGSLGARARGNFILPSGSQQMSLSLLSTRFAIPCYGSRRWSRLPSVILPVCALRAGSALESASVQPVSMASSSRKAPKVSVWKDADIRPAKQITDFDGRSGLPPEVLQQPFTLLVNHMKERQDRPDILMQCCIWLQLQVQNFKTRHIYTRSLWHIRTREHCRPQKWH